MKQIPAEGFIKAALTVIALTIVLGSLALKCGNIHGGPQCGPLSYVATLMVIVALVIETMVFGAPQSDTVVNLIVFAVALTIALIIVGALRCWKASRARNKIERSPL